MQPSSKEKKPPIDDSTKYKKRSQAPTQPKANHKHQYVPCVYQYPIRVLDKARGFIDVPEQSIGTYCPECGRIGCTLDRSWMKEINYWPTYKERKSIWKPEAILELDESSRTIPFFVISDRFNKFIPNFDEQKENNP